MPIINLKAEMGEVSENQELIAKLRKQREYHVTAIAHIDFSLTELGEEPVDINPAYAHFSSVRDAVNFYLFQNGSNADIEKMKKDLVKFGVGANKTKHKGGALPLIQKSITQLIDMGYLIREDDRVRLP